MLGFGPGSTCIENNPITTCRLLALAHRLVKQDRTATAAGSACRSSSPTMNRSVGTTVNWGYPLDPSKGLGRGSRRRTTTRASTFDRVQEHVDDTVANHAPQLHGPARLRWLRHFSFVGAAGARDGAPRRSRRGPGSRSRYADPARTRPTTAMRPAGFLPALAGRRAARAACGSGASPGGARGRS